MQVLVSFAGIAVAGSVTALAQNELGSSTVPVTAGIRTNAVALTATSFVANAAAVTNGVFVGDAKGNVPPTSIFGANPAIRPITMDEAIQQALANNFDIQVARLTPEVARFNLAGDYAVYEPTMQIDGTHSYQRQPGGGFTQFGIPNPAIEYQSDLFDLNVLNGYAPSGLRYSIGTSVTHSMSTTRDDYTGGGTLSLRQPLLKNFWTDSSRAQILVDKKRLKIAEWQLRGQLITSVANLESAYYDLIRTRENIKVQRAALEYNNQLLRENRKRVEVGALAPLDEKQAEAEVARGVATLLQTEQAYAVAQNNLKLLITQDFSSVTNVVLDPVETLVAIPANTDLPESWKRGLTMRPEIQQAKLDLESRDINIKFLKNQVWPALDLVGTYGHSSINDSYWNALTDLTDDRYPRYSYGAVLSFPLGNRGPRNAVKAAKASKEQAILQYKQLEQSIMISIDNAIKLLQSQFQQVEASRQARLFAQDALSAEQKKYENGKSTSFLVLQFQRDLTSRRFEELSALADYNKALAALAAAEGATLTRHSLDVTVK